MAIEHTCQCGTKLRVKDELAGKKIKCPKCSETFTLPAGQAAADLISVSCKCGKSFQAKATMAGKSFQCISCNRTISIPPLKGTVLEESDPFASNQPSDSSGTPFDANFPDLGIPEANYVPYHAPITDSITNKAPSSSKTVPDYRGIPARPGIPLNFNQDVLIIVTAVLCILYGLGGGGGQLPFRLLPMVTSGAIFTVGGALWVGKSLVCLGILLAGIGLLKEDDWAVTVGQIAASMYFVLALIDISYFFLAGSMEGHLLEKKYLAFGLQYLSRLIGESIAPALLLYITFRGSKQQ
ncbi:MAG: hypothetical protein ACK449_11895 [Planctomycetota bacterium]|jgi:hypothetical protein